MDTFSSLRRWALRFSGGMLLGLLATGLAAAQSCPDIKVTVSPAGPLTLCPGSSVTLTATAVVAGLNTGTGFDGNVNAVLQLTDGYIDTGEKQVLVGGNFGSYQGRAVSHGLVRLNPDGSLDAAYGLGTGFNGAVRALVEQADGKLLVGGDFTAYNGTAGVNYLARLNRDGSLDASFRPGAGLGAGAGNAVNALALLPDGRVLAGGQFSSYDGTAGLGNILLLTTGGTRDATVGTGTGFDAPVRTLLPLSDGTSLALVGGDFTHYRGAAVGHLARLTSAGLLDAAFPTAVGFNGPVLTLIAHNTVVNGGAVVGTGLAVGGAFTSYNGAAANRFIRLDYTGVPSAGFSTGSGFDAPVRAITSQYDGELLVGGSFTSYNGITFSDHHLLRLNTDGSQDFAYNTGAGFDADVYALLFYIYGGNEKLLAGGAFGAYQGTASLGHFVRLNGDATLNNADQPAPAGLSYAWSNGTNGFVAGNGNTFVVTQPGFYRGAGLITASAQNCFGASAPVVVNPPLQAVRVAVAAGAPATLCAGGTTTLTATATTVGAGLDASVLVLARQPDGKLLVGGDFSSYNGEAVSRGLMRLNADGSLDASFNPRPAGGVRWGFSGEVERVVLQPDGKVLVAGGSLGSFNGDPSTSPLVRLNADGSFDRSFGTEPTYGLALQADGKVLAGGYGFIRRFNTDGSADATFNPGGSGIGSGAVATGGSQSYAIVSNIVVQPNGRILIAGAFHHYNGNALAPDHVMRLNADGTPDLTFNPGGSGPDNYTNLLLLQPDGKVVIASNQRITAYNGNAAAPDNLMRLNADGSLDAGFNAGGAGFDNSLWGLALQPNGQILVGGGVSYNGNQDVPYNLQRINADGSFDTTFNPLPREGFNDLVYAMLPLPSGQIVAGGAFTRYNYDFLVPDHLVRLEANGSFANPTVPLPGATYLWSDGSTSATRSVARPGTYAVQATASGCSRRSLPFTVPTVPATTVVVSPASPVSLPAGGSVTLTAGVVRPAFVPGPAAPAGPVRGVALQADNQVLVGGAFTATGDGRPRLYRARYSGAGVLDNAFAAASPALNGEVAGLLELADGRVLAWGSFTAYGSTPAPHIVRLQADGSLDASFAPAGSGLNGSVACAKVLFGGKILVGGSFTSYSGVARPYVAQLNPDGSLDTGFVPAGSGLNGPVTALAEQTDGRLLLGGRFTRYNGQAASHLARLLADGSFDVDFLSVGLGAGPTIAVAALAVQENGQVLVGGSFADYNGETRANLVRLGSDGNLDASFTQAGTGFDGPVAALVVQPDGKVVAGGSFASYGGSSRARVARLNPDGSLDAGFAPTGSGFNGPVAALALQADGQLVAGGSFTSYAGTARPYVARLNADGSLNDVPTPVSGATFSWNPGGSTANPLTVSAAGTYTPTATLPGGCTLGGPAVVVGGAGLPDLVVSTPQNVAGDYHNVTVTGPGTGGAGTGTLTGPLTVTGTLTVEEGGTLLTGCQPLTGSGDFVLAAGGTLGICDALGISRSGATGSVQLAGSRSFSDDATYIYLSPTVPQITGSGLPALVRELRIDNAGHGATLTSDLDARQAVRLSNGPLDLGGHTLTLRSVAAGTALVDITGGNISANSGTCRMQRYIDPSNNPGLGYRHYSSPMQSTAVGQLATVGFAPVLTAAYNTSATPGLVRPFPTVYGYDQVRVGTSPATQYSDFNKGWYVPTGFDVGRGLTVNIAPPALVTFTGEFNFLDALVELGRGPQAEAGYHLLGNPYPAPFDLNAPGAISTQNVGAAVYVFASTAQYAGQYRTLVNGIGNGAAVVPAGQAFFVRTATAGQPSSFGFARAGRVTTFAGQPAFQRSLADTRPQVALTLAAGPAATDAAFLYAEAGATPAFDAAYDATKILNPGYPSVYCLATTGEPLAVQGLPALAAGTVVPLAVVLPAAGPATFAAELLRLPAGLTAFLTDAATGTRQDLLAQPTYAFTAAAGEARGRFALVVGPPAGVLATAAAQGLALALFPNPAHGMATLTLPATTTGRVARVLDALGREVRQVALPAAVTSVALDVAGLPVGVYAVRVGAAVARLVVE